MFDLQRSVERRKKEKKEREKTLIDKMGGGDQNLIEKIVCKM